MTIPRLDQQAPNAAVATKICGITTEKQAREIAALGVDFLGINFWPRSKRFLPEGERAWLKNFRDTALIGLFVNQTREEILAAFEEGQFAAAQLHGDESPEFCDHLAANGVPVIKAIGVKDAASLATISEYSTPYILLDAYQPETYGGGGETFSWSLAKEAVITHPDRKIALSGGIHPENAKAAVEAVRPAMIDVASGVESAPGIKDLKLCERYLKEAKAAAEAH